MRLRQHLVRVLAESGSATPVLDRGGAELRKGTRIARGDSALGLVEALEVLARLELLAVDDLVDPGDRRDQETPLQRRLQQLRLGPGARAARDDFLDALEFLDRLGSR